MLLILDSFNLLHLVVSIFYLKRIILVLNAQSTLSQNLDLFAKILIVCKHDSLCGIPRV